MTINLQERPATNITEKKCFVWQKNPLPSSSKESQHNVIRVRISSLEGPARALGQEATPRQVWDLLFTPDMVHKIVEHTNVKLESMRSTIDNQDSPMYKNTDYGEMNALIGLVLL